MLLRRSQRSKINKILYGKDESITIKVPFYSPRIFFFFFNSVLCVMGFAAILKNYSA